MILNHFKRSIHLFRFNKNHFLQIKLNVLQCLLSGVYAKISYMEYKKLQDFITYGKFIFTRRRLPPVAANCWRNCWRSLHSISNCQLSANNSRQGQLALVGKSEKVDNADP